MDQWTCYIIEPSLARASFVFRLLDRVLRLSYLLSVARTLMSVFHDSSLDRYGSTHASHNSFVSRLLDRVLLLFYHLSCASPTSSLSQSLCL